MIRHFPRHIAGGMLILLHADDCEMEGSYIFRGERSKQAEELIYKSDKEEEPMMRRPEARKQIISYLDRNGIRYKLVYEDHKIIRLDAADEIYICTCKEEVIGRHIETTIRFKEEGMYLRSFYCQRVVHNEEEAVRAARILNYINMEHNYDCFRLYEHTFHLDEQEGDIFIGANIRYELLQKYPEETMAHILNYSVQIISELCAPILLYVYGKLEYERARDLIDRS